MKPLAPADRERFSKLLAFLESEHCGERDDAVLAASRLLERRGVKWCELLSIPPRPNREPLLSTGRRTCEELLLRPGDLRPWERKFVADLPGFPRISTRQRYVLAEIAERVLGGKS